MLLREKSGVHTGLFPAEAGPTDSAQSGGTGFSRCALTLALRGWVARSSTHQNTKLSPNSPSIHSRNRLTRGKLECALGNTR